MCDAKPRRHTRPVPRLFSQWYGLVHNNSKHFSERIHKNFVIAKTQKIREIH